MRCVHLKRTRARMIGGHNGVRITGSNRRGVSVILNFEHDARTYRANIHGLPLRHVWLPCRTFAPQEVVWHRRQACTAEWDDVLAEVIANTRVELRQFRSVILVRFRHGYVRVELLQDFEWYVSRGLEEPG